MSPITSCLAIGMVLYGIPGPAALPWMFGLVISSELSLYPRVTMAAGEAQERKVARDDDLGSAKKSEYTASLKRQRKYTPLRQLAMGVFGLASMLLTDHSTGLHVALRAFSLDKLFDKLA